MVDYRSVGVDAGKKEGSLQKLLQHVTRTFDFNSCKPLLPIGYYANVIDLRPAGFAVGIAFSTDGVGTKLLVADLARKYDTVGIDCVAMNVNDILCVGATPVSMVDYIAVTEANAALLEQIGKGLSRGCELAAVNLSGGELAQVAELLAKKEGRVTFDIVGTAIGIVNPERLIVGQDLAEGDVLIGLESSGLHSNGYTLARKICFDIGKFSVDDYSDALGRTVGEELLEPTRIYVKEILEILRKVPVKALFHITGDGLFNLTRTIKPVGYRIENFPEPPPVFQLLQRVGRVPIGEMFRVFNMGIGFALVVPPDPSHFDAIQKVVAEAGYKAHQLGHVVSDANRTITMEPHKIVGKAGSFVAQ
jgi:phosphoribosylformylglycinamidine cyclo-ligase